MTNTTNAAPALTDAMRARAPFDIGAFDLTPEGLADAPAHQEDSGSIVHTGNS